MSFESFMKANKKERPHVMYPATKSLTDENGQPLLWELKPITTAEDEKIRESCMVDVPVKGKPGRTKSKLNANLYLSRMACAAVVVPDLQNPALQNSYGTYDPEELLKEMIDDPAEFAELAAKVQAISGFSSLDEDIEEAKN